MSPRSGSSSSASHAAAPLFTILADADGNEVCVCTWQARDEDE